MPTKILGLLAETFIHAGAGSTGGAVDLPVAREAATGYPYIPGSSLKGALLHRAKSWDEDRRNKIFGKQESAGGILVSDARLLLLPVRSLTSAYRWVTCPHLIERLERDLWRGAQPKDAVSIKVDRKTYLGQGPERLYLEERSFRRMKGEEFPEALEICLKKLIAYPSTAARITEQTAILHDDDFSWFARYGLPIQARNQLTGGKTSSAWVNPETGKEEKGNLWYEESLPPDTLMYMLLAERSAGSVDDVAGLFEGRPYLQAGGNETVGQGWFAVQVYGSQKGETQNAL